MEESPINTHLPVAPQPQRIGLAIASMVLGILAVTCFGLFTGLPAIILGHLAYSHARKAPEQYGGAGFAIAGFVMGYASILVTMLLLAIAVPNFVRARAIAQKNACIGNLKQIDAAKVGWALENKKTDGEAVNEGEINAYLKNSARPICPAGGVYHYNVVGLNPTCSRGPDLGHTL